MGFCKELCSFVLEKKKVLLLQQTDMRKEIETKSKSL